MTAENNPPPFRLLLFASLFLALAVPCAAGLPSPSCSLALGANCDTEAVAPNCCVATAACIDDATTSPTPHFSCSSCIPAGSSANCNAEDIICCAGLECGASGICQACPQAGQACSGTGQGTCCAGLTCDQATHLCCGGAAGGKSPDGCRQCIDGTAPLCTCDPASAQAGTLVSATKSDADTCGYTMPADSSPIVSSDVKNCIGYVTVPPAALPVTVTQAKEFLSCYLSDCTVLGTHIGYDYGKTVTAPIIGKNGITIGVYNITGMTHTARDAGDCDTRYIDNGGMRLIFDPAKVASVSSVSISGIAADDACDFDGYTSGNWACDEDCSPVNEPSFVPFTKVNDLQFTRYWSIRDRCPPSASLRATFTITYTPATPNIYEKAPLTYAITKTCTQANRPPPSPPVPIIAPSSGTALATFSCTKNCPPTVLPVDPDGDTVSMFYKWYRNGAETGKIGASFDCSANGCLPGNKLKISAQSCDNAAVPACSSQVFSNEATVASPVVPQSSGGLDLSYIIMALVAAIGTLALAYMAGRLFGLPQMGAIVQDEVLQVIATGVVALSLLGVQAAMDSYGVKMVAGSNVAVTCTDWNDASTCSKSLFATASGTLDRLAGGAASVLNDITGPDGASRKLGEEASKGLFCNFLGTGFTLVNCSQLNAFRGGLTLSSFAAMAALADTYAQKLILSLVSTSAFAFIIPLGLFLRCFKVSRRAGGALIAIGFGFYTVYPAVIVATENLMHGNNPYSPAGVPKVTTCDPEETNSAVSFGQFILYGTRLTSFELMYNLTYFVLVRVIFMSILNLIITLGFIRALAHVIGSDIDVSALARIS